MSAWVLFVPVLGVRCRSAAARRQHGVPVARTRSVRRVEGRPVVRRPKRLARMGDATAATLRPRAREAALTRPSLGCRPPGRAPPPPYVSAAGSY